MKPAERDAKKAEVIATYRAFAEREGGVPGAQRFVKETAAKDRLWRGGLWPSWSAFLLDAGFTPNEPTQPLDDDALLRGVAELTRQLSRLPTENEMRFARSQGATIASDKTYATRFGNRDGIAAATMQWAVTQPGYDDVIAILSARVAGVTTAPDELPPEVVSDAPSATDVLADRYVPPIVACLPALAAGDPAITAACRARGLTDHVEFERRVAIAFRLLGLDVKELGQGAGRVADGVARSMSGRWALIYDAKQRRSGFAMGTEDRKFREYVATHAAELRRDGIETLHFVVISSTFADSDVKHALDITATTLAKSCVLLEAAALLAMVDLRLRTALLADPAQLHRVFVPTRVVTVDVVAAIERG